MRRRSPTSTSRNSSLLIRALEFLPCITSWQQAERSSPHTFASLPTHHMHRPPPYVTTAAMVLYLPSLVIYLFSSPIPQPFLDSPHLKL